MRPVSVSPGETSDAHHTLGWCGLGTNWLTQRLASPGHGCDDDTSTIKPVATDEQTADGHGSAFPDEERVQ